MEKSEMTTVNRPHVERFWKKLCAASPMCKENTCKQYAYSLSFLYNNLGDDFADVGKAMDFLRSPPEDVKVTTSRRLQCTCALKIWHLRVLGDMEQSNRLEEPLRQANVDQATHRAQKHKKADKNWVHIPQVRKEIRDLRKAVLSWDRNTLWGKTRFHQAQLAFFMTYMLCGKGPCRRDLCNVTYGKGPQRVDVATHEIVFESMLKDRKTKSREPLRVKLCRDSWALFSRLRKQHVLRGLPGQQLLYNKHFNSLKANSLNAYLAKMCQETLPCFKGKRCTVTLMRRMFVTWKRRGDLSKQEKADMAQNMNHSVGMQEGYRSTEVEKNIENE